MKKIATILLASIFALTISAQSDWTQPDDDSADETEQKQKAPAEDTDKKKEIDSKYLEGAVPLVEGRIRWEKDIPAPGQNAQDLYQRVLLRMMKFVKGPEQTPLSRVAVVNQSESQIGVRVQEILTFQKSALTLDQTKFVYTLMINCTDGNCHVIMTNLAYSYEEGRETASKFMAEEMISDENALNKKKNGFTRGGSKKFRMKTIDRKDEIFDIIADAVR